MKQAFRALGQELRAEDRVAIVVYAGAAGLGSVHLGRDKPTIMAASDEPPGRRLDRRWGRDQPGLGSSPRERPPRGQQPGDPCD